MSHLFWALMRQYEAWVCQQEALLSHLLVCQQEGLRSNLLFYCHLFRRHGALISE